jgi:hypothetical protein
MSEFDSLLVAFGSLDFSITKVRASEEDAAHVREHYKRLQERGEGIDIGSADYYEESTLSGHIWGVTIPESARDLRTPREMKKANACECRLAKYPLAIGGVRAAYHAKVKMSGESEWKDMIVKEFMLTSDRTEKEYQHQSENSAVSHFLCDEYRKLGRSSKEIHTLLSRVLKLRQSDGTIRILNMEATLPDPFVKWTNNAGNILNRHMELIEFAKWTHVLSDGYLLVSDLQGVVKKDGAITLTDPAVLCTDLRRFGPTNINHAQMKICLDALHGRTDLRVATLGGITVRRPGFSALSDLKLRDHAHLFREGAERERNRRAMEEIARKAKEAKEAEARSRPMAPDGGTLYFHGGGFSGSGMSQEEFLSPVGQARLKQMNSWRRQGWRWDSDGKLLARPG